MGICKYNCAKKKLREGWFKGYQIIFLDHKLKQNINV